MTNGVAKPGEAVASCWEENHREPQHNRNQHTDPYWTGEMNDPVKTAASCRLHRPWTSCKAADCGGNLTQQQSEMMIAALQDASPDLHEHKLSNTSKQLRSVSPPLFSLALILSVISGDFHFLP
ncbi:hypothetical protein Q8A67_022301 [Cirrhinus molitorella]|uniref:Uncharacterized protein n=1 Tax=Cirrhinus molitorella TaxID=172907 RepID=A0AA88TF28_9TELE|nr:hypothetical protein Q8A67_022301 [Cirrhinus molitorella]